MENRERLIKVSAMDINFEEGERVVDEFYNGDEMLTVTTVNDYHTVRRITYYISNVDGEVKRLESVSGIMVVNIGE